MPDFIDTIIPRVCKAACKSSEVAVKVLIEHKILIIVVLNRFADFIPSG